VSAATSAFDSLDGLNLRDGSMVTVANRFRDEPAAFDTESLTLRIRSSTMTFIGSMGITDRLEVGAAVPFVRLTVDGQRVSVYRGRTFLQASGTASSSGMADVALRAKYTLLSTPNGGVAAASEVRLPTGDDRNLLGAGSTAYRLTGIGSFEQGTIALHGNASVVRGGISSELALSAAASVAVHPRVTLSGELLARRVSALHDIALTAAPHPTISGVDTLRLTAGESGATLARTVAGVKWNVAETLVIGGHVTWTLVKRGLTAPLTPTMAIEYSF
jgi:hypothetical protein